MKHRKIFNKWWLLLIEGVLLILLSYFIFSHPDKLLATSITIAGFIALLTGTVSVIAWFLAGNDEKHLVELIAGICSCVAGIFFLSNNPLATELVMWFFAAYMIFNAATVISTGWQLKDEVSWWWISLILLLYTLMVLYIFISSNTILGITLSVFAAMQFFINGILFILLAVAVYRLQQEYNKSISQIRKGDIV